MKCKNYLIFSKKQEKTKFKKGETERILAFEFYQKSYDASCEIKMLKNERNDALKKNHTLMWDYVQKFSMK